MNDKNIIRILILSFFVLVSCKTTQLPTQDVLSISVYETSEQPSIKINFNTGEHFNYPTFVLWMEDLNGEYLKTLYLTQSYASGIFGHELVGDSIWKNTSGPSFQPAALPYWTNKKGLIDGEYLIPTPEHPYIDAYTGATPPGNFEIKATSHLQTPYKIMLEVNQTWDWNEYWTNNKYPENKAYSHSSQPSIIYAVEINNEQKIYYMNPIGHGSPKGENGKLYTDLSTLSTAKKIFKTIKIEIF